MKGSYILFLKFNNDKKVVVGRLGLVNIKAGWYAYVGSGMNSLIGRIARHFKKNKIFRWHIDYLTSIADEMVVFLIPNRKVECELAKLFNGFESVKGFGCSDCSCKSHLFYLGNF